MELSQINDDKTHVLKHLNGKTVNEIIAQKLAETSDSIIPPDVQGAEIDGQYDYNKAHIAALAETEDEQDVFVLHADSPTRIYVCPSNQIGFAENITAEVNQFGDLGMAGHSPNRGKLCLAKSLDDDSWYRAACVEFKVI